VGLEEQTASNFRLIPAMDYINVHCILFDCPCFKKTLLFLNAQWICKLVETKKKLDRGLMFLMLI